jgi:nucleoside-diphosphate-sugar epimerase
MVTGITGASGFIGSALVRRHVEAGHSVRCLTRDAGGRSFDGVHVVEGDLEAADDRLVRFADGLDVLYHCAGELMDERRMAAVNVDGVRNLLHAASGRVGRWVQLSSAGVYGSHHSGTVSEDTPLDPRSSYERTKAEGDALVLDAAERGAIASVSLLRPSIVFGAGMRNQSIAQMIRMVDQGLFFFIGAEGASANYVHVSEVVEALVRCGTAPEAHGRVYNLSDWCTVEEFVGAIADALRRPRPRLRLPERPVRRAVRVASCLTTLPLTESRIDALVGRARYCIDRIRRELDYSTAVTIPEGLAQMVASRAAA